MAVKDGYKIPASLDSSWADFEIVLPSPDNDTKSIPVKVICAYLISFVTWLHLLTNNKIIREGTIFQKIVFSALWVIISFFLFSYDKTKVMNFMLVETMFEYLPKANRIILTRLSNNAGKFLELFGIQKDMEYDAENNSLLEFKDGTSGYMFQVVGSASHLLFDSDKVSILNRVDGFYRKLEIDCEYGFLTLKAPQKTYLQLSWLKKIYLNLKVNDPDLRLLIQEREYALREVARGEYKSIHQYMFIKAENKELLRQSFNMLKQEVENSSKVFKRCSLLTRKEAFDVLSIFYKGGV